MRFSEFLRTTVLISAAAASLLAVVTILGASGADDDLLVPIAALWWVLIAAFGVRSGRLAATSPAISRLLASARSQPSLPEVSPARVLLNRLWPLLIFTLGAGALGILLPQVPAIAAGFAMWGALALRRQASAVTAIEERDGARFYIERTSPLREIRLVRTPGFRSNLMEMNGTQRPPVSPGV